MNQQLSRTVKVIIEDPKSVAEYYIGFLLNEFMLKPQVTEWLVDNVKANWSWNDTPGLGGGGTGLVFYFTDPDDAMLFKLTWGGV